MPVKIVAAAALLAALVLPAPAKAYGSYYLVQTVTYYNPYSSQRTLVGGPFTSLTDCHEMQGAEPYNHIEGGSISYSCEMR